MKAGPGSEERGGRSERLLRAEPRLQSAACVRGGGRSLARRLRRGAAWAGGLAFLGASASVGLFFALDARSPFTRAALVAAAEREVAFVDGTPVARRVSSEETWHVPLTALEDAGRWLPLAMVAVEDARFHGHPGVDPRGVVRAAWANARAGRVVEGASTITMQVVGMALDTPRTFRGKAVEAFRALQLERIATKDEILEVYLNRVPMGGNLIGVGAGARAWFGKEPRELSLDEAALLAGLPNSPARLRPDRFPERARARRRLVLERMRARGMIDDAALARADAAPLPERLRAASEARPGSPTGGVHAVEHALATRPSGGRTTLDPALQGLAEGLVARHLPRLPAGAEVALVVIDVREAAVRAWIGSGDATDPVDGQVDGVRARRSPGSALKPFVYAAAFEAGLLGPDAVIEDAPIELGGWSPRNFDEGFAGAIEVGEALRRSLNTPAFRAAAAVGLEAVIGTIEAVGIDVGPGAYDRSGLALVTGAAPVRLFDLVTGYATLARGGEYVPTRTFADAPLEPGVRVLSESTCEALFAILCDTARAPRVSGGPSHVGGHGFMWKTGTSSGHVDALAVGHDRRYAAGVWVGRFDGAGDPAFVGAEVAEPILAELMAVLGG